ncbi:MAG: hypothetical protein ACRDZY_14015 [Acidimicrobiales bacterium]
MAVVPLWHAVVTAKLAFPPDLEQVRQAQGRLDATQVEAIYPLDPGGILTRGRAVLPGRREGPGS